jgi:hypothetical protein
MAFYAAILLLTLNQTIVSNLGELEARERAERAIRSADGLSQSDFVRLIRREDLEDDLFGAQLRIKGQLHKGAYFFEATQTGYEILSPEEAVFHSSTDGARRWILAVGVKTGKVYGLLAFKNSIGSFNGLAQESVVRISNLEQARGYASFFLRSVVGARYGSPFSSLLDLKRQVEDFYIAYETSHPQRMPLSRWWDGLKARKLPLQFAFDAVEVENQYVLTLDTLAGDTDKRPFLQRLQMRISKDGEIGSIRTTKLYPQQ